MADHQVLIIGAGFGGMGAAIALRKQGYGQRPGDILILEREDDLGGTWHVNRYPGLAVDIPSVAYSFSFEPNPRWQHWYARGAELKKYAAHVADKYDLRRLMRFGVSVESARWDEDERHWVVATRSTDGSSGTTTATYVVTATGFLSQPKLPDIPGVEEFAGELLHTADWDDTVELDGKRVGVIGTGATAVQLIPQLARRAAALTVYQRTPIWVTPKQDFRIPPAVQRLFARAPAAQRAAGLAANKVLNGLLAAVVHYRQLGPLTKVAEAAAKAHLRRQVPDPELRRKLTPDYSFGCKRPTFANDYYPTFTLPHVTLETDPIERITPQGVVTAAGERAVDVLVCATGFNLWDSNFPAIEVIGRDGRNLFKEWRTEGFHGYEGVTVHGYPNLAVLQGPYSYNGLNYFTTIEGQMVHLERLFGELRSRDARVFEVSEQADLGFTQRMLELMPATVFERGDCATARSYYFNNAGDAVLLRPASPGAGMRAHRTFPLSDYAFS